LPAPGSKVGSVVSSAKMRSPAADVVQNAIGERLQMEADAAHPARHQIAGKLDLVASIDRLLAIERQTVGVLGDGDLGQEPFRWNPRLDQMRRRRRLIHPVAASDTGITRPARHDHPEPRRDHVEAFRDVLADLDPVGGAAGAAARHLRLDHDLDPLEMGAPIATTASRTSEPEGHEPNSPEPEAQATLSSESNNVEVQNLERILRDTPPASN
jgi:hypothetical protein